MECLCSIDQIILKLKTGAVVKFRSDGASDMDGSDAASSTSRNIISPMPSGKEYCWPIAEAFWLDRNTVSLPSRDAHPVLVYRRTVETAIEAATNHMLLDTLKFPADNYVLETSLTPSPPRGQRWLVYIQGSKGDGRLGTFVARCVLHPSGRREDAHSRSCTDDDTQATQLGSYALRRLPARARASCLCCCRTTSQRSSRSSSKPRACSKRAARASLPRRGRGCSKQKPCRRRGASSSRRT